MYMRRTHHRSLAAVQLLERAESRLGVFVSVIPVRVYARVAYLFMYLSRREGERCFTLGGVRGWSERGSEPYSVHRKAGRYRGRETSETPVSISHDLCGCRHQRNGRVR